MTNKKVVIVDCGVGNLYSISKAIGLYTENMFITDESDGLMSADAAVIPGVGAFGEGMRGLAARGLVKGLKAFALSGKPILGICLGAQILLSEGYEFGKFDGLNLINGKVVKFPEIKEKVPHIGWNKIYSKNSEWKETILDRTPENANMYFVHSFVLKPEREENILALSEYGGHKFCSVVRYKKIFGCQFHPEKSGEEGLKIIESFLNLI